MVIFLGHHLLGVCLFPEMCAAMCRIPFLCSPVPSKYVSCFHVFVSEQ